MKKLKQRIAVWLCILMAAPTIWGCLPMTSLQAEAASSSSVSIYSEYSNIITYEDRGGVRFSLYSLQIEEGETFEFGDLLEVYDGPRRKYFEDISGEKYTSSDKSVATISGNNGTVKVKKAGTTVLKVTYRGASFECKLTVAKKGKLGATKSSYNSLGTKAKKLVKAYGKGITSKNRYKVCQLLDNLEIAESKVSTVRSDGFKYEKDNNGWLSTSNKLVVPELLRVVRVREKIDDYVRKNNPIGTTQSKQFKISSVSGKGNTVTINLKKKVTSTQIFAIKAFESYDHYDYYYGFGDFYSFVSNGKTAVFPVYLKDSTGHSYHGRAVAVEGSKTIYVTMDYLKMKKGEKYQLLGLLLSGGWREYDWTKNKSFKAK